jgi:hypothetical protein
MGFRYRVSGAGTPLHGSESEIHSEIQGQNQSHNQSRDGSSLAGDPLMSLTL